jgi:hypothetical protein
MSARLVAGLTALALATAAPAVAQTQAVPTSLDEARAQGYTGRPADEPAGSMLGGLLAIGPGFFVHGVGHYYTGDEATALKLLIGELLGAGLVVAGALVAARPEEAGRAGPLPISLVQSGVFLFLGSWLADVVGTFKGAEPFDDDTSRLGGHALGLGYRYVGDPRTARRHRLVPSLTLDSGRVFVQPSAEIEPNFSERRFALDVGGRPWRGAAGRDHIAVGARLRRDESAAFGYATRAAEGWLAWKLDLGQLIARMRRFSITQRYAVGIEQFQFGASPSDVPAPFADADFTSSWFSLASGFAFNAARRTHLTLEFVQDPTVAIPAASAQSGLLRGAFSHQYRDDLDIDVEILAGDGFSVALGLVYAL